MGVKTGTKAWVLGVRKDSDSGWGFEFGRTGKEIARVNDWKASKM